MRTPDLERAHPAGMGGTQRIYRFANGLGASVVRFPHSYGYDSGRWELGVVKYSGPGKDQYRLTYETPVTDDVLGHLSEKEVDETLAQIEALPPVDATEQS